YLYTAWSGQAANRSIMAGTIDSPDEKTKVLPAGSNAGYADPGYLVFHREEAVYAQSFDAGKLTVSGEPVRVANEITYDNGPGRGDFSVSRRGALAYFYSSNNAGGPTGGQADLAEWQYSWMSRTGQLFEHAGPPGLHRGVDVSHSAELVA